MSDFLHVTGSKTVELLGFDTLTGEACEISKRYLYDINEDGAAAVCDYLGVPPGSIKFPPPWNSRPINGKPRVGSVLLPRYMELSPMMFAAARAGYPIICRLRVVDIPPMPAGSKINSGEHWRTSGYFAAFKTHEDADERASTILLNYTGSRHTTIFEYTVVGDEASEEHAVYKADTNVYDRFEINRGRNTHAFSGREY